MKPRIQIKRVYDASSRNDGFRVLVDRLWPRGLRKEDLHVEVWAKEIAPSTKLRQWFGHDPQRWPEFRKRYEAELRDAEAEAQIRDIIESAGKRAAITLLYSAKDTEHNQAIVLKGVIERMLSGHSPARRSDA